LGGGLGPTTGLCEIDSTDEDAASPPMRSSAAAKLVQRMPSSGTAAGAGASTNKAVRHSPFGGSGARRVALGSVYSTLSTASGVLNASVASAGALRKSASVRSMESVPSSAQLGRRLRARSRDIRSGRALARNTRARFGTRASVPGGERAGACGCVRVRCVAACGDDTSAPGSRASDARRALARAVYLRALPHWSCRGWASARRVPRSIQESHALRWLPPRALNLLG
jgi:hypothetical protein